MASMDVRKSVESHRSSMNDSMDPEINALSKHNRVVSLVVPDQTSRDSPDMAGDISPIDESEGEEDPFADNAEASSPQDATVLAKSDSADSLAAVAMTGKVVTPRTITTTASSDTSKTNSTLTTPPKTAYAAATVGYPVNTAQPKTSADPSQAAKLFADARLRLAQNTSPKSAESRFSLLVEGGPRPSTSSSADAPGPTPSVAWSDSESKSATAYSPQLHFPSGYPPATTGFAPPNTPITLKATRPMSTASVWSEARLSTTESIFSTTSPALVKTQSKSDTARYSTDEPVPAIPATHSAHTSGHVKAVNGVSDEHAEYDGWDVPLPPSAASEVTPQVHASMQQPLNKSEATLKAHSPPQTPQMPPPAVPLTGNEAIADSAKTEHKDHLPLEHEDAHIDEDGNSLEADYEEARKIDTVVAESAVDQSAAELANNDAPIASTTIQSSETQSNGARAIYEQPKANGDANPLQAPTQISAARSNVPAQNGETILTPVPVRADQQMPMDQYPTPKLPEAHVNPAFDGRQYHPPDPELERPMSFVPLPRDQAGNAHEIINVYRPPPSGPQDFINARQTDNRLRRASKPINTSQLPAAFSQAISEERVHSPDHISVIGPAQPAFQSAPTSTPVQAPQAPQGGMLLTRPGAALAKEAPEALIQAQLETTYDQPPKQSRLAGFFARKPLNPLKILNQSASTGQAAPNAANRPSKPGQAQAQQPTQPQLQQNGQAQNQSLQLPKLDFGQSLVESKAASDVSEASKDPTPQGLQPLKPASSVSSVSNSVQESLKVQVSESPSRQNFLQNANAPVGSVPPSAQARENVQQPQQQQQAQQAAQQQPQLQTARGPPMQQAQQQQQQQPQPPRALPPQQPQQQQLQSPNAQPTQQSQQQQLQPPRMQSMPHPQQQQQQHQQLHVPRMQQVQQPQNHAPRPSMSTTASIAESQRPSTSPQPEGKKKRFSALGTLLGRAGSALPKMKKKDQVVLQQQQQQPSASPHPPNGYYAQAQQHQQQRPWNLTIPAANDQESDREQMGREILFAAQRRWAQPQQPGMPPGRMMPVQQPPPLRQVGPPTYLPHGIPPGAQVILAPPGPNGQPQGQYFVHPQNPQHVVYLFPTAPGQTPQGIIYAPIGSQPLQQQQHQGPPQHLPRMQRPQQPPRPPSGQPLPSMGFPTHPNQYQIPQQQQMYFQPPPQVQQQRPTPPAQYQHPPPQQFQQPQQQPNPITSQPAANLLPLAQQVPQQVQPQSAQRPLPEQGSRQTSRPGSRQGAQQTLVQPEEKPLEQQDEPVNRPLHSIKSDGSSQQESAMTSAPAVGTSLPAVTNISLQRPQSSGGPPTKPLAQDENTSVASETAIANSSVRPQRSSEAVYDSVQTGQRGRSLSVQSQNSVGSSPGRYYARKSVEQRRQSSESQRELLNTLPRPQSAMISSQNGQSSMHKASSSIDANSAAQPSGGARPARPASYAGPINNDINRRGSLPVNTLNTQTKVESPQGPQSAIEPPTTHKPFVQSYHPPPLPLLTRARTSESNLPRLAHSRALPTVTETNASPDFLESANDKKDVPPPPPPKLPLPNLVTQDLPSGQRSDVFSPSNYPLPQSAIATPAHASAKNAASSHAEAQQNLPPPASATRPIAPNVPVEKVAAQNHVRTPSQVSVSKAAPAPLQTAANHPSRRNSKIGEGTATEIYELPATTGPDEDEPVMMAVSYPGDEWIPEWNGMD